MSIDHSMHSLFGVSKTAADLLVQEYGRYFGMKTVCFRGGCLTGPGMPALSCTAFSRIVKCAVADRPYTVFGYKGKQVRDNIHSHDLVSVFWQFFRRRGSQRSTTSAAAPFRTAPCLEAITDIERLIGRPMRWSYRETSRAGDRIWYISDLRKFQRDYPDLDACLSASTHPAGSCTRR